MWHRWGPLLMVGAIGSAWIASMVLMYGYAFRIWP